MASKKKGLSMEEKVEKIEQYFHEHPIPFTLKELLVNIPKAKGVIHQSVEEVLELLVSEGRVRQEKIGISVFYWYFPVDQADKLAGRLAQKREQLQAAELDCVAKEQAAAAREASIGGDLSLIAEAQAQLEALQQQRHALLAYLDRCAERDPHVVQAAVVARRRALDGVNRWTDNIFLLEDFVCKRMQISRRDFRSRAQIPQQFDFFEDG